MSKETEPVEIVTEFRSPKIPFADGGTKKVVSVKVHGKEVPFVQKKERIYFGDSVKPKADKASRNE